MNNNSYDQFFSKAQDAKRNDTPKDRVQFSTKPKTNGPAAKPTPQQTKGHDQRLRKALKVKRQKAPFPWKAVFGLTASLGLAGGYIYSPETFEKLASKIEIRAMTAAGADEKPAEKSKAGATAAEKAAGAQAGAGKAKGPDDKTAVSEDTNHFDKLKQRKDELDVREKELTELEEELQKQKVELDKRITQLEEMRNQISQTLKDRVEVDQEKVNKTSSVRSTKS